MKGRRKCKYMLNEGMPYLIWIAIIYHKTRMTGNTTIIDQPTELHEETLNTYSSDSFTILSLWVLGLPVSHIDESSCQRTSPEHFFLMTSLLHPGTRWNKTLHPRDKIMRKRCRIYWPDLNTIMDIYIRHCIHILSKVKKIKWLKHRNIHILKQ